MGLLGDIGNAISKPIRGIGRIARGKFKQGIGDIGSGLKSGGKFVAPFNPVAGALMTGVGSIADKVDDPGGLKKWKPIKDTIAPAAINYGIGRIASGIGGGAPGGVKSSVDDVASGMIDKLGQPVPLGGAKLSGIGRIAKAGGNVLRWAEKNPELALGVAGMGLEAHGAQQLGQIEDQQVQARRRAWENIRRRRAEAGMSV